MTRIAENLLQFNSHYQIRLRSVNIRWYVSGWPLQWDILTKTSVKSLTHQKISLTPYTWIGLKYSRYFLAH